MNSYDILFILNYKEWFYLKSIFVFDENLSDEENQKNVEKYKTKEVPKKLLEDMDIIEKKYQTIAKSQKKGIFYLFYFLLILGVIIVATTLMNLGNENFVFLDSLPLFIIGCLAVVGSIAYFVIDFKKAKKFKDSDQMKELNDLSKKYFENRNEALGVPEDAINCDILFKRIKKKHTEDSEGLVVNIDVTVYVSNGEFCICDTTGVYSFPLNKLKAINPVNCKYRLVNWNKPKPAKEYGLKYQANSYAINGSYELVFDLCEECRIEILPYDYENVKNMLGNK